jgi:nucleotidyltransferase substrate binding protein (TIGR01987 family)
MPLQLRGQPSYQGRAYRERTTVSLDLSSSRDAILQVEEALAYAGSDLAKNDPKLARHLRAGAIQAFEFTYELSIKMLKRYLQATEANPASVDEWTFNDLILRGYEVGLLQAELSAWKAFRRDRGTTSHAYDEAKAIEVYATIPAFLAEAKFLFGEIDRRQSRAP